MNLKNLTITFSSNEKFLKEMKDSLSNSINEDGSVLSFDSVETFKKTLTENRLEILMAIAREKPVSIYQLAKYLNREHPHVARDCRILEFLGFINLEESEGIKKQITPRLVFDYDFIVVKDKIEKIFSISQKSNDIFLKAIKSA